MAYQLENVNGKIKVTLDGLPIPEFEGLQIEILKAPADVPAAVNVRVYRDLENVVRMCDLEVAND